MQSFDRLPAIPLIAEDPYFSVWLPGDLPNDCTAVHWTGAEKPVSGFITVDGERYRFLGGIERSLSDGGQASGKGGIEDADDNHKTP